MMKSGGIPAATELVEQINREHQAAFGKAREALAHARRAGELLLQAKDAVGHGAWLPWLRTNCVFSERTAQAYMRLASRWDELQAKSATAADLTLRGALGLLVDDGVAHRLREARDAVREWHDAAQVRLEDPALSIEEAAEIANQAIAIYNGAVSLREHCALMATTA